MSHVAVRKVKELDEAARRWVMGLLGRELQEEEQITVLAFAAPAAPPEPERHAAAERLGQVMDEAAQKASAVPDDDLEAAINEAMEHVRPRGS